MASTSPAPGHRAFAVLLQRPDPEIDLVAAALQIARSADPTVDPIQCQGHLEALAGTVRQHLEAQGVADVTDPHAIQATLAALNQVLFTEAGFHGNADAYYDPRNSYLNEVLARRTGIPITLALVYIAVARRVGLRLHGVGLPGHFMVGWAPPGADLATSDEALFIDPFHGGVIRTPTECAFFFHRLHGSGCPFVRQFLAPVTAREFLTRLLGNLKSIYLSQNDLLQTLRVVDYLLLVHPRAAGELRLRGMLYYRLGAFVPALSDLRHYLQARPDAPDAPQVRYHIALLHNLLVAAN